jgi:hypothetical protein
VNFFKTPDTLEADILSFRSKSYFFKNKLRY